MNSSDESISRPRKWVPYADSSGRKGWVPAWQANTPLGARPKVREPGPDYGDMPVLRQRTPQEKLDSLTQRLVMSWRTQPWLIDGLLAEIQGEYWKAGAPVSVDQLRALAGAQLQEAERRAG